MNRALALALCTAISMVGVRYVEARRGWLDAVQFAVALGTILAVHEGGHVWMARRYGFRLGLPWFIPAPVFAGTLGAVIRMRELPPSRAAQVAMGAAGPLAGFAAIVACALLAAGDSTGASLPRPLLFHAVTALTGVTPNVGDPVGFAAWIGCVLTAVNLLPAGQLDGGHILAGLRPSLRAAGRWGTVVLLLVLALWWWPWLVLALAMGLFAEPMARPLPKPDPGGLETGLALACGGVFALAVVPIPGL